MQKQKNLFQAYSQAFISSEKYDSKAIYAKRRLSMMKKLDSFCIFAGMPREPGAEEAFAQTWTRFVQEPAFLYLTGLNEAGCFLVMDPLNQKQTLFLPKKDPFKEFWFGKRVGYLENDDTANRVTGFDDVRPSDELWSFVDSLSKKYSSGRNSKNYVYAYYFEKFKDDHNWKFMRALQSRIKKYGMTVRSASTMHFEDRLVLEDERVAEARRAQQITDQAFRALLRNMKNIANERELSLYLNYEMQRRSDGDLAFPTIVAGGDNAVCLHYVKNDEKLHDGRLVLLDFGVRYGTLHSDISRTIPVNGKFNPLQKMLYQIVLDSAKEYKKFVRPGVSLKEIGMVPWDFIVKELDSRLVKNACGTYKLLYDKRPHGVSHFIGEQIHEGDPGSRSLDVPLKSGMLISCEPGVYGEFEGVFDGKRIREVVGIRIEDDLLITEKGFLNISKHIPREIDEIEKMIAG